MVSTSRHSRDISVRFGQHVRSGRFTQAEVDAAERIGVRGGRTAREIAEQQKIDELEVRLVLDSERRIQVGVAERLRGGLGSGMPTVRG